MPSENERKRVAEWRELYELTKQALEPYGEDNGAGGDYFVLNLVPNQKIQLVEMHRLHMLRPRIIKSLQRLLSDFPGWQILVYMINPEEKVIIDPEHGLMLRTHEIIDAFEHEDLPANYRFNYEGSRRAERLQV